MAEGRRNAICRAMVESGWKLGRGGMRRVPVGDRRLGGHFREGWQRGRGRRLWQ